MAKQQSLTANRLASIEREMDSMTHDSSEGLRASIYLAHARKEYAAGNYGIAEIDLDEVAKYLRQVKGDDSINDVSISMKDIGWGYESSF